MTKIKCLRCGEIIMSKNRNQRVWCSCGTCSIKENQDFYSISGDAADFEVYNKSTKQFESASEYFKQLYI